MGSVITRSRSAIVTSKTSHGDPDGQFKRLEDGDGRWKTTGRIVDSCMFLDEHGKFVDLDSNESKKIVDMLKEKANAANSNNTTVRYQ